MLWVNVCFGLPVPRSLADCLAGVSYSIIILNIIYMLAYLDSLYPKHHLLHPLLINQLSLLYPLKFSICWVLGYHKLIQPLPIRYLQCVMTIYLCGH